MGFCDEIASTYLLTKIMKKLGNLGRYHISDLWDLDSSKTLTFFLS